jgi:hypothetical protein
MKKVAVYILIMGFSAGLMAQPQKEGSLGQFELSVTEAYKAQVAQARKIGFTPAAEDTNETKIPVSYSINSLPLPIQFSPEVLPPARIKRIEVPALNQGLVKAGFGLYNTPFVEAYYNSKRSSKQSFGFYGRHFSTQAGVEDIVYEQNPLSRNSLGGFYKRFYRNYTLSGKAELNLDRYTYYGQPNLDLFPADSNFGEAPLNRYRQIAGQIGLVEAKRSSLGWLKSSDFGYSFLNDNYGSTENDFNLNSHWLLPAADKNLKLDLNLWYFNTRYDSLYVGADSSNLYNQGTFQLQFRPHISTLWGPLRLDFGLNLYSLAQTDSRQDAAVNDLYFFPEVVLDYPIVKHILKVSGGIKGSLQRNTYRQLTQLNPYLTPGMEHVPLRTTDLFVNLQSKLSNSTSLSLQGGLRQMAGQPLFYRNPNFYQNGAPYGLDVRYAVINSTYLEAELAMLVWDNLSLGAQALLRNLESPGDQQPWYMADFIGGLQAAYTLKEKIKLATKAEFIGPRQAFAQAQNPALEARLPGFVDMQLEVEYLYNSKISAFIKAANLLNAQYDFYLGYRAQSVNVLFGFAYGF